MTSKPFRRGPRARLAAFVLAATTTLGPTMALPPRADARTLEQVKFVGAISMCANPETLPYSSKGEPPGYQLEIGRAIAEGLGVGFNVDWIVPRRRANVVNCDMLLDTVNDPKVYEGRLLLSIPYQRTGIALGLRAADADQIGGLNDLRKGQKIGVMIGSVSSVLIGQRGLSTSPYAFQTDMLEDLLKGELFGAALSPAIFEYYNHEHPEAGLRVVPLFEREPGLAWTMAVGLRKSDHALLDEVNRILARLLDDGTISRIYASYGLTHRRP